MIARTPSIPTLNLIPSSRLGLVSIPASGSPAASFGAPETGSAFDREEALELLQGLGRNLGMTLLATPEEAFPEAEAAEGAAFPDAAVRKTLEALDAVWMNGNDVAAAFVLETGTGSPEGVRRLADLLALHPKSKAPLYVVSLPALRGGLLAEINRPVYRMLKKSLGEAVRLLDWNRLESEVRGLGERVRYLKAEFLEGISDVVEPPAEV